MRPPPPSLPACQISLTLDSALPSFRRRTASQEVRRSHFSLTHCGLSLPLQRSRPAACLLVSPSAPKQEGAISQLTVHLTYVRRRCPSAFLLGQAGNHSLPCLRYKQRGEDDKNCWSSSCQHPIASARTDLRSQRPHYTVPLSRCPAYCPPSSRPCPLPLLVDELLGITSPWSTQPGG